MKVLVGMIVNNQRPTTANYSSKSDYDSTQELTNVQLPSTCNLHPLTSYHYPHVPTALNTKYYHIVTTKS